MRIDSDRRVNGFLEKPKNPEPMPGETNRCLANMGVYVFDANFLFEELCRDATVQTSSHDFGKDVIPHIVGSHLVKAYPFWEADGRVRYWRDVGTIDAYFDANMDLIRVAPELNLYDRHWEIRTYQPNYPPPKFVFAQQGDRVGQAHDSMVCSGTIVSGGQVTRSILSHAVRVNSWARVEDSILFEGVDVGRHARIRRAIIDKGVQIPEGARIGYDLDEDRRRGFTVSESGIVVLGKLDAFAD
jgi:glucose-1-phosphate adenylyltransferase